MMPGELIYNKCGNTIYRKSCSKKAVRKDFIERYVVEKTNELVLNDETINRLADKAVAFRKRENTVLPVLQKQLDDVEKAISNLLDAIQQGLFNASAKQRLDDLEFRKMDLEISIASEYHNMSVVYSKRKKSIEDEKYEEGFIDRVEDLTLPYRYPMETDIMEWQCDSPKFPMRYFDREYFRYLCGLIWAGNLTNE